MASAMRVQMEVSSRSSLACTSNRAAKAKSAVRLTGKTFLGDRVQLATAKTSRRVSAAAPLKVEMALSKAQKDETVVKVKSILDETFVVAGITYQGLSVKDVMEFRRSLPKEGATFMIMKNTLMNRACVGTPHEPFGEVCKGPNGFLMIGEEHVPSAIKETNKLITEYNKLPANKEAKKEIHFVGGSMEGKLLQPEEMKKLESLPTKADLLAKIAGILKAVPTKLGVAVNAMPTKTGMAVAAYKKKLEEEGGADA